MLPMLLMLKGSKEALKVLIVTHVTHVERVKSGVCGLYTQYFLWIENRLNIKKVMSKNVYVPCFNIT